MICIRSTIVFLVLFFFSVQISWTQDEEVIRLSSNKIGVGMDFGYGIPLADMSDRFGNSGTIGLNVDWIRESNWVFGLDGKFIFGSTVKEDPLAHLRSSSGFVFGVDNQPSQLFLRERGAYVGLRLGRFIPLDQRAVYNLKFSVGAGVLDHFIRFQDDSRAFGQVVGDYVSGYDRKTRGFSVLQELLFQKFDPRNRFNYYFGLDFIQGFTQNIRPINFDTRTKDDASRSDLYLNFKVGLSLFFISGSSQDDQIYY